MFHKVIVFINAAFKDRKVTYMASNNIKSVGKSIGVKVSPILFAKVSVLVSARDVVSGLGPFRLVETFHTGAPCKTSVLRYKRVCLSP